MIVIHVSYVYCFPCITVFDFKKLSLQHMNQYLLKLNLVSTQASCSCFLKHQVKSRQKFQKTTETNRKTIMLEWHQK